MDFLNILSGENLLTVIVLNPKQAAFLRLVWLGGQIVISVISV